MEVERVVTQRSIDAWRFLQRGTALLDAVVLVTLRDGAIVFNGMRITPDLVLALRVETNLDGAPLHVDQEAATIAWSGTEDALLLRTPHYTGALPDLSLSAYQGPATLLWKNTACEARIAFGRAGADAQHDAQSEPGSMGAPLFDDAWGVIGLHKTYDQQGARGFVPIARLTRELEQSPLWDEVASVHRLVRSVTAPAVAQDAKPDPEPDLARALRWSAGDEPPIAERERRRAVAGKSLAELRIARGNEPPATAEQRALDRVIEGPPYALDTIDDAILLPFATAARWFRGAIAALPDDAALEIEIGRRRQHRALVDIVGPHFAPREQEAARLSEWLANPDRPALVVRGPGGIGKSALLAHFVLENAHAIRRAWIDFDRPDVSADEASITRVVDQQLAWQSAKGPLVVVLDSFEVTVQTYGYTNLNQALDALARRFDDVAVVVGSRAPVPLLKLEGEPALEWQLAGLPFDVVLEWLETEGIARDVAGRIASLANGVPLNMKLGRDLVAGRSIDEAREVVASLPQQLVTGYLYRRILRRLRDDSLREHAQWAMVPRRLVPELLAEVVHVPKEEAARLFAALRSELTLLEGDTTLTVRADLRNTLLPLLEAEDATRVREIDTIAADFWAQHATDEAGAAEAVYHSLRLADTARAQQLWRNGIWRHLGGYAMEELPPASQAWLEEQLSRESSDQAVEGMLARGDVSSAASRLRSQPPDIRTVRGSLRRRRVGTLAQESNLGPAPAHVEKLALEAIVLRSTRPAMRVHDGTFTIDSPPWAHLELNRSALQNAVAAAGRVLLPDGTTIGTAVRVAPGRFVTTRSIAERFAVGSGHGARLIAGRAPTIDMRDEGEPTGKALLVTRVLLIHPYWDIAIVEASDAGDAGTGASLTLATNEPPVGIDVVVVGHPSANSVEESLLSTLFADAYEVKRLMPGKYVGRQAEFSFGRTVSAGLDNAISVSEDVGAAVVDATSGQLLGVRFAWVFLDSARFVPAWELMRDPAVAQALALDPPVAPPVASPDGKALAEPAWLNAWSTVTTPRHTLLDAYVARSSGDVERARALLDVVADDDAVRIDRTLLDAACVLTTDRARAGDLLQELVDVTPRDGWSNEDRDAVIATRLRLVVDVDAEQGLLDILHEHPLAAELLNPGQFRVLLPPGGNLPWGRAPMDATGSSPLNQTYVPADARVFAHRIVRASNRCNALRGWIESNAGELPGISYLFNRAITEVRELAAAYVAFPVEMVRSATAFLIEKTDVAPHPRLGWGPIVEPLFMLFRDARGRLPDGVNTAPELEAWLVSNATSGRLGAYLTERLRVDSPVAWQAGLLHLTTELPIEGLLKRRFSGEQAR